MTDLEKNIRGFEDCLMTRAEFVAGVKSTALTDWDGHYDAYDKDGNVINMWEDEESEDGLPGVNMLPGFSLHDVERGLLPKEVFQVLWYNK